MGTDDHRRAADRKELRYPSDLSDREWTLVEPLIPPAKRGGRKRSVNVREVLNGIFYVLSTGCQWKALPKDLPPKSTVYDYLDLWSWARPVVVGRRLARIHHELYVSCREQAGREASPSAAIPGLRRGRRRQPERQSGAKRMARPVCKQFPRADLSSLHQRIRSQGRALAKMEIRASRAS